MSGTLFVVATPIGNLEDITLRALRVLRDVSLIAAEDTRRTAGLLAHHGISTSTTSFHAHNSRTRIPQLLGTLKAGTSIALVTDAGTPGISDPGVELVAASVEAGIAVDPIPGVSAPLAAAVASGFPLDSLTILGFAPSRSKDRIAFLSEVSALDGVVSFFDAPHRMREMLIEAKAVFGDRPIVVARELTKVHQEFLRGTADTVLAHLQEPRGEFTIVVGPAPAAPQVPELPGDAEIANQFGRITEIAPGGRRRAVSAIAKRYGRPTREIYDAIERAKKSGERP
jgi:16S rRNA (cytidine1402-2'-O)-methyltransferase